MIFTTAELEYLRSQFLGRLATVGPDGRPHVTPVGVFLDDQTQTIVIAGHTGSNFAGSKKFRDAQRNPEVAFVVDDLVSVDPWTPRMIEIRGRVETHTEGGAEIGPTITDRMAFDSAWMRLHPHRIVSFGINEEGFEFSARDVA